MITALASNQARAISFSPSAVIAEGDLQRGIDRFGTRICKKAVVDSGRRHVGDLSREFDRLVVGIMPPTDMPPKLTP